MTLLWFGQAQLRLFAFRYWYLTHQVSKRYATWRIPQTLPNHISIKRSQKIPAYVWLLVCDKF